eukprot:GHVH01007061.1.p1 GENE.GHVH01007061.1~~GHVH01007061.1.p1  ORF type:complete len:451 (+),score=58.68 GHVH01007061.1:33-1355(+)
MDKLLVVLKKHSSVESDSSSVYPDGGVFIVSTHNKSVDSFTTFGKREDVDSVIPVGFGSSGSSTLKPTFFFGYSSSRPTLWRLAYSSSGTIKMDSRVAVPSPLKSMAVSKDGVLMAGTDLSGRIFCWQAITGLLLRDFQAHAGAVSTLLMTDDQGTVISCGEDDGTIKMFLTADLFGRVDQAGEGDSRAVVEAYKTIRLFEGNRKIRAMVILPGFNSFSEGGNTVDGTTLAVLDGSLLFLVYVPNDGNDVSSQSDRVKVDLGSLGTSVCASPDGCTIAIGTQNGTIRIYDVRGIMLDSFAEPKSELSGSQGSVTALVYSRDGRFLSSAADDGIRTWNLASRPVVTKEHHESFSGKGRVTALYGYIDGGEDIEESQAIQPPAEGLQKTIYSQSTVPLNPCHFVRSLKSVDASLSTSLAGSRVTLSRTGTVERKERCIAFEE